MSAPAAAQWPDKRAGGVSAGQIAAAASRGAVAPPRAAMAAQRLVRCRGDCLRLFRTLDRSMMGFNTLLYAGFGAEF